jgi:hypothetical protein
MPTGVLFVPKPTTLIRFDEIANVTFSRVGAGGASSSRTFDLRIVLKKAGEHQFSSLAKEEHGALDEYFRENKVKVKNEMAPDEVCFAAAELFTFRLDTRKWTAAQTLDCPHAVTTTMTRAVLFCVHFRSKSIRRRRLCRWRR